MSRRRLAILISGSGSNLQAFIDAVANGTLDAEITVVISNRAEVYGLERARKAGIPAEVIDHKPFISREAFDAAVAQCIEYYRAEVVILAGFLRVLTPEFVERYRGRLLNIHPSLLPKFPGLHTHQRAIAAGETQTGATVHFVTADLDAGPGILQASVAITADDTQETLAKRVLAQEHQIYPLATGWLCSGRLKITGGIAHLDDQPLPRWGKTYVSV